MKCTIVGQHLKIISKSVRLLSKFSEQAIILAKEDKLTFQAVNDTKSAFTEVIFRKEFFASYDHQEEFECRVDVKSLLLVFRMINLDRVVEFCKIKMGRSLQRILFEMKCKYGVFREYDIPYMESEMIKCSRISERVSNPTIKAPAKVFSEIFKHFATATREATVWIFADNMRFMTFIENDDQNYFDLPSTSFCYVPRDFTLYNYSTDISATFGVKNIKAFLDFALYQNQLVSAYFQPDAKPIEFVFNNNADGYLARVIMATIEFSESQYPEPPPFNQSRSADVDNRSQNTSINNSLIYSNTSFTGPSQVNASNSTINNQPGENESPSNHLPSNSCANEQVEPIDEVAVSRLNSQEISSFHNDNVGSNSRMNRSESPALMASFSSINQSRVQENNQSAEEEISNIVEILDDLPDFAENEDVIANTQSAFGSPLILHGEDEFERGYYDNQNEVIASDSDED